MRLRATFIILAVVAGACGGTGSAGDTTAAPTSTTTAEPTTTTQGPEPTTTQAPTRTQSPPTTQPPDTVDGSGQLDRSILSLGLAPGDTRPGRFRLQRGPNTETLMTVDGRYWVTDGGNVYTALDLDTNLIATEMTKLVAAVEADGGQPPNSPYIASLRDHYRGDEFQIGLTDLVRSLAVGGLPAEWAEQWSWFIQADGNPVPPEHRACLDAIPTLDDAAREWIHDLEIEFIDGTWAFPAEQFETALAAEIETASICESVIEVSGPSAEIVLELSGDPEKRRIDVLVDDKTYTDREPELVFAVVMWADESVGPAPQPKPAPLLTVHGSYLAAISVCGELPWIYSNFAASNTYHEPGSGGYNGPTILESGWYCENEVPQDRRND